MERDQLRLECIRIAAQRSPEHGECLNRAEDYYKFIMLADAKIDNANPSSADLTVGKDDSLTRQRVEVGPKSKPLKG